MVIYVNKNIDDYKDDFFKGLTFKQTVISGIAVTTGVCMFLLLHLGLRLPQSLSLYLTLPVVFPLAAAGFVRIHGMNLMQYFRQRKKVRGNHTFVYYPEMLRLAEETEDNGYWTSPYPDGTMPCEDPGGSETGRERADMGGLS